MIRAYLASLLAFGLSARRPSVGEERGLWYANVTGDFLLGALFPVHRRGTAGQSCGEIQIEDGVQPLEAMLYTVGRVNDDPRILPGVKLGVLAFDTCDNPGYALEGAFHFVKGFVARSEEFGQGEAGYRCEDRSAPKYLDGGFDRVIAILGAQSSSVTIQVASVLALFPVPQISYMATSPFLSSKERFPHFYRTVPNDVNQARAMLEILRRFEWSYVSVVYSDSEYGDHGYETLVSLADEYSICFSAPHRVVQDRFTTEDYDNVVRTIAEKTEVRVVVLFAEKSTTLLVLEAARRVGVGSRFVWLGSDSWPDVRPSSETREIAELEGALAVQPLYASLSGFDEYFTGLRLDHERTNPWFREFWQKYHDCADERVSWKRVSRDPRVRCDDPRLKIQRSNGYKQHRSLHFVRDAVYAAAYALHELHRDVCGEGYRGVCEEMLPLNERAFSDYLAKVSFNDEAGNGFGFVDEVDGPPRYSILNYQRGGNGSYRWVVVGNYTQNERGRAVLRLDRDNLRFRDERFHADFPVSSCSRPCGSNRIMVRVKEDPCCWRCQSCGRYRYKVDEQRCEECEWGSRPSENGSSCEPIPEQFVDYSNPWAVVATAVAVSGESVVTVVAAIEPVNRNYLGTLVRRYRVHLVRLLGLLEVSRHADDQGVRSRVVLPVAARHVRLFLDDVRRRRETQRPQLRHRPFRNRFLLHDLLRRARHQDQQDSQDIQRSSAQSPQATVHQSSVAIGDRVDPEHDRGRVRRELVAEGTAGGDPLVSEPRRERSSLQGFRGRLLRDRIVVPVRADRRVHRVRDQDQKVSRRIQRDAANRVRQLRHDNSLVGVRAPLPGLLQQRGEGDHSGALAVPERAGATALSVPAESLRGPDQTGEEHQGTGDGPTRRFLASDRTRDPDTAERRVLLAFGRSSRTLTRHPVGFPFDDSKRVRTRVNRSFSEIAYFICTNYDCNDNRKRVKIKKYLL